MTHEDAVDLIPGYARAGIRVLPLHRVVDGHCTCGHRCATPGKHPRLRHGVKDASTDPGQCAEWLAKWALHLVNWGGEPWPGTFVWDEDRRNGGDVTRADLEARHGLFPRTLTGRTGNGFHRWFTCAAPTRGTVGPGIDIKKQGGYVVLPPSVHPNGQPYAWVDQSPAVPAPRWLRELLAPPSPAPVSMSSPARGHGPLVRVVLKAQPGERNNVLFWALCRATENGLDHAPLIDAAVSIGLSRVEAEGTSQSARTPRERSR